MRDQIERDGRPRRYDFPPAGGFAHPDAAYLVAALDELSERLFDLILDLPQEVLDFVPEGGTNSISMLVRHIARAEAGWVAAVTEEPIPAELGDALKAGAQDESGTLPPSSASAADLVALTRRVRDEITKRRLAPVRDIDTEVVSGERTLTVRGVLMNQLWHWTHHTGQVAHLRRLAGSRYKWAYDARIAARVRPRD